MVKLDWTLREERGVCLVELRVENPTKTAVRVRIANELAAPLWPPRCGGLPESGWDDDGWEGVVAPKTTVSLGYASPAPPVEPPMKVAWDERAESPETETEFDSATAVVQALGDASPPRDAVPVEVASDHGEQAREGQPNDEQTGGEHSPAEQSADPQTPPTSLPPAVSDWLLAVERDVARAEQLSAVETVREATDAVSAVGGLCEVRQLAETVAETKSQLESLSAEAETLETRLDETDIPVETLAALA